MLSYQSKNSEIHGRQLDAQKIVYTGNLSTGVGTTNLPSNVVVDNTMLNATTVTLNVAEQVKKCFRVTVRQRSTGANILIVSAPDISVANKISIILDATALTDVVIEFIYSVYDPNVPAQPAAEASGPDAVDLLTVESEGFAILAKTTITNTTGSLITGDLGLSPGFAAAITGFALTLDGGGQFSTSASVVGSVYAADYAAPTPAMLTQAITDMEAAYTDAAGRPNPDTFNYGAGIIGGLTLQPGIHKWTTAVTIPTDLTLNGGASDVFILQIAGTLNLSAATSVVLTGGVLPENVFWAVAGAVTLGVTSEFNGILLAQTSIAIQTNAVFNGKALAQSAVTLDDVTIN